jgi:hypothetical protein
MKPTLALLLIGAGLAAQLSVASADTTEQFIVAQSQFESGLRGSEKDNEQASEKFRSLTAVEPDNPLYLAYYGSTFAIKARDAYLPWKKLKLGETGLDLIDKALRKLASEHDTRLVRGVPLSIETRLVAVNTFFLVPDQFFHRFDRGRSLLTQTMESEVFAASPAVIQARYWFQAAAAQKEGRKQDEIAGLKRVAGLDPDSLDAPAAAKRLKEIGQ